MNADILLELGTEEIPAGFVPLALSNLERIAREGLTASRIEFAGAKVYGTPRRLVLHVSGASLRQPDAEEELLGPSVTVAFDASGNPTKAGAGFAKSKGVEVSDLVRITTDKGEYIGVRRKVLGRDTREVLETLLPQWIAAIPFKKSMRWGSEETAFARPIHWILALLGSEVLTFSYADVTSGRKTAGHRFHAPDYFEVMDANDYFAKIEQAWVIVDPEKRKKIVLDEARKAAQSVGGKLLEDDELLDTVTFLVESPTAVVGSFEAHYLELPKELLILSMKTHQKYFAVVDESGKLMNHFVTTSNTRARNLSVVARGNERVLRARLSDARFFFDEDVKTSLEEHAEGLKTVVFQSKLGTSYEKVERFSAVADAVAGKICPDQKAVVARIAKLCKADLVTMMVYEFPELQGSVGREYALKAGENPIVAQGIQEHYRPVAAGGDLPSTAMADCVSLGDKLDTICGCFGVGLIPTGAADPYALRRQTIGILRILLEKGYRLSLDWLIETALEGLKTKLTRDRAEVKKDVTEFFRARLEVFLTSEGFPGDTVASVLSAGFDDVVDLKSRLLALDSVRKSGELVALAGTFKRAANILKGQNPAGEVDASLFAEKAETDLWQVYGEVKDNMTAAIERGDYQSFLASAARLKLTVDGFFDGVMVMCEDVKVKDNRILMMAKITSLFGRVADFTKITTI